MIISARSGLTPKKLKTYNLKPIKGVSKPDKASFSPDGRYLAVIDYNYLKVYDVSSHPTAIISLPAISAEFLPDGKRLAIVSHLSLSVVDVETGEKRDIESLVGEVYNVKLLTAEDKIALFPMNGIKVRTLDGDSISIPGISAALTRDGRYLYAGFNENIIGEFTYRPFSELEVDVGSGEILTLMRYDLSDIKRPIIDGICGTFVYYNYPLIAVKGDYRVFAHNIPPASIIISNRGKLEIAGRIKDLTISNDSKILGVIAHNRRDDRVLLLWDLSLSFLGGIPIGRNFIGKIEAIFETYEGEEAIYDIYLS